MNDVSKRLAAIEKGISEIKENMSTKGDMRDLESRLTGDIKTLESGLKGDMKNLEGRLKSDMKQLEIRIVERIEERIDEAQMEIIATVDKHKADKDIVRVLEKRVERLEDNAGLPPHLD